MTVADGGGTSAFLRSLAERASADPAYLAWVMRSHAEATGQSTTDVLIRLGVAADLAPAFLVSLRPTGARFSSMLTAICLRFGADERALLTLVREVEVLDAFRARGLSTAGATDAGLLMAARMREKKATSRRVRDNSTVRSDDEQSGSGGGDAR
jgi:hypothetical protein